ncbi:MAG: CRTAC1 family protein [Planctomycetaceae bacterium]
MAEVWVCSTHDPDGELDVFCVGGGGIDSVTGIPSGVPSQLFRGVGGKFAAVGDVSRTDRGTDYSHGCTVSDVNNDGFPDLLVTCFGRSSLLVGQGDGTFTDQTERTGLISRQWSTAAAVGDVNSDGNPDVMFVGYVDWKPEVPRVCNDDQDRPDICPPQQYDAVADHLYLNMGDGRFADVSETAGIRSDGKGLGVVAVDLDGVAPVDFFVANDVVANHLYVNWDGTSFSEIGQRSGVGLSESGIPEGSMGIAVGDVNRDSRPDLLVTNFELEDNSLYIQRDPLGHFQHSTSAFGLGGAARRFVGFGTGFTDFDADGWLDLYVLNGHVRYHSRFAEFRQPALLFQNRSGVRFHDVTSQGGAWFTVPHCARGGAVGDFNNDGSPDLFVSLLDEPVAVLANRVSVDHWVSLILVGTESPRHPVGTKLTLTFSDGTQRTHFVTSGAGYLSSSDVRILMSVPPAASSVSADVIWPSGHTDTFSNVQTNTDTVLIERRTREFPRSVLQGGHEPE